VIRGASIFYHTVLHDIGVTLVQHPAQYFAKVQVGFIDNMELKSMNVKQIFVICCSH
jgi:hypothetical protein